MMGTIKYHYLKQLSEDDCWLVFSQHAFENIRVDARPDLVSIGRKIVAKCGGLPLAARTLGGLLRCKSRSDEWKDVLNSKMWELDDNESDILPALRLSYCHLPSHLKKCFAYCSILPNDYEFEAEDLVLLWMAEGFIQQPQGEKQMEDLGYDYFRELVARSFFQPSSRRERSFFVMHDLINDLAQFVARRICFRLEDKSKENEQHKNIGKARHASYTRGYCDGIKKFEVFCKAKNLRTFLSYGSIGQGDSYLTNNVPTALLPSLTRLRVLSLRRYRIGELMNSIGHLKHVRYLDLSSACIKSLPESLGTLYNLQTLIIKDCQYLEKLPIDIGNLINLRHLDVSGSDSLQEMPPRMGELTNLKTLSNYVTSKGNGSMIRELGNLIHLRGRLCISGLENVVDTQDAKEARLDYKQDINVLSMKWSNNSDNSRKERVELEVLEVLQPHMNLKKLTISSYHGLTFPSWVGDSLFSDMAFLTLENCEKCTCLPPLGQLPKLKELHIQGMKAVENVGLEFYGQGCSNPFPSLATLSFENMPEWKDWSSFGVDEEAQAFARLTYLSIKRCPKLLGKLPSNLPRLEKLKIEECPQLAVEWLPSPTMLHGIRNTLHFDSLTSLSLKDVSIPGANDEVVMENATCSHLSSLTTLKFENIKELTCLPSQFFQGMTGLQDLMISRCEKLTTLWQNKAKLQNCLPDLRLFVIESCPQLISLFEEEEEEGQQQQQHESGPPNIMNFEHLKILDCKKLEKLPRGLPSTLRTFKIDGCESLQSLPELMMLSNLEGLEVWRCPLLACLCPGAGLPPNLKKLYIHECGKLESVLAEKGMTINCPSLELIQIRHCDDLKTLPDVMQNNELGNLSVLEIVECGNLESLPGGWFPTANLRKLRIRRCKKLEALPQSAYNSSKSKSKSKTKTSLTSLQDLHVSSSPAIAGIATYVMKEGSSLTNLTSLGISSSMDKPQSEWGLHRLPSLRELYLEDYGGVSSFPEEEDGLLLPTSLIELRINHFRNLEKVYCKGFQTSLTSLQRLYIWDCPMLTSIADLGLLPSLAYLWIYDCPNLASFTEQGLPLSLLELYIDRCPILKQQCEKEKGKYWPFINNIPLVRIL